MADDIIQDTYRYKSTDVALHLAAVANERRVSINMTKIQKLLYITYGVFLRVYRERLLNEHPQAWPYGPVFPTTRNRLLKLDLYSITAQDVPQEVRTDAQLQEIIAFVFSSFGGWNAGQLSEWTHRHGSPWEKTTSRDGFVWGGAISDDLIYDYFSKIVTVN